MLSVLDRRIRFWHVALANIVALAWFAGIQVATQAALPGVKLFRCPIGMCLGYYSPNELNATLTRIGRSGRQFFAETLLPLDMVLPALLLVAFWLTYVWFSRPGQAIAVPLSAGARYAFLACRCSIAWRTTPRTGRWWSRCRPIPTFPTAWRAGRAS